MLRRKFFAAIVAPFLTRFVPKPLAGTRVFSDDLLSSAAFNGGTYIQTPLMYTVTNGINPSWDGTVTLTEYWHKDHAPFVIMPPIEKYPWEKSSV